MTAAVDTYVQSRPIRPLPKRRLRFRLSEDARAEIFAPSPTNPARVFNLPFGPYGDIGPLNAPPLRIATGIHTDHNEQDFSDDDDSSQPGTDGTGRGMVEGNSLSRNSGGGSGGSGLMDSYDWVENTNNKKKRKIPSPVNLGGATGNANGGTSTMNIASQSTGFSPNGPNTTPRSRWKSSGTTQRSPLSASSSSHPGLRRMTRRYPQSPLEGRRASGRLFSPQSGTSDDSQSTTSSQNDNYQASSSKSDLSIPRQSQFTFEHITPASTSLALQAIHPNLSYHSSSTRDHSKTMSTVGTQTSPNLSTANTYLPASTAPRKKGTRKLAPQQRQRRQVSGSGYGGHNNNNNGEIWICEFCEYESIFGEPPEALMRQYELKDRRERRRLREKQRLLDKAKQKGKKNQIRNNTKKGAGNSNAHHSSTANTPPPAPPPSTTDSQGTQSDNTPLASANATPALKPQRHNQQVQTDNVENGNSHHISAGRGASGGSISGRGKNVATGASGAGGSHAGGQFGTSA